MKRSDAGQPRDQAAPAVETIGREAGRGEERVRKRELAVGWTLFAFLLLAVGLITGLLLLALPLLAIAFPLTLSAVAVILIIGWWRQRRSG